MSEVKNNIGRIPPHNIHAEKSILGAMILSNMACATAMQSLIDKDFYLLAHQKIYEAMFDLHLNSKEVDLVTLSDKLDMLGVLEVVGGYDYLAEISEFVPIVSNIEQYINIVKNDSILRQLIDAAGLISEDCFNDDKETSTVISNAEKAIFDISQSKTSKSFIHVRAAANEVIDIIDFRYNHPNSLIGLKTGYPQMDKMLLGLKPSELILIASRPSMGKTALGLNIAQQAAFLSDAKVAMFSLEMPYEQLIERMMSSIGELELQKIKTGALTDNDWDKLGTASDEIGNCNIFIDDTSSITIPEIISKCRRLKIEKGVDLVIIDYLQLLSSSKRNESRLQEISEMTRMLKIMAMDLAVPVILLSQLSRAPEQRKDHRPILSDLRDSGTIEQDADVVMFVYRQAYYDERNSEIDPSMITNTAEIIVAKNRSGPTGVIELAWDGSIVKFMDVDTHHNYPT